MRRSCPVSATGGRHGKAGGSMFKTTTRKLIELAAWLAAEGCPRIAMEATGIYERTVWHGLG
jgi:hypothetical protein